jgi:hypothetical protein
MKHFLPTTITIPSKYLFPLLVSSSPVSAFRNIIISNNNSSLLYIQNDAKHHKEFVAWSVIAGVLGYFLLLLFWGRVGWLVRRGVGRGRFVG